MDFIKIGVNGDISVVSFKNGNVSDISNMLGGFEIVRTRALSTILPESVVMIVDDNFYAHHKSYNCLASGFYPGGICGDALLIPEFCGEFVDFADIDNVLLHLSSYAETMVC